MRRYSILWILCAAFIFFIVLIYVHYSDAEQTYPSIMNSRNPNRSYPTDVFVVLRSASALTTSYVETDYADLYGCDDIGLFFEITRGSLTSFEYKVQWSYDGYTWFDEVTETVSATTITDTVLNYSMTLTGDVDYYKPLPFRAGYIRLQVKGTGTVSGSSCKVSLVGRYN